MCTFYPNIIFVKNDNNRLICTPPKKKITAKCSEEYFRKSFFLLTMSEKKTRVLLVAPKLLSVRINTRDLTCVGRKRKESVALHNGRICVCVLEGDRMWSFYGDETDIDATDKELLEDVRRYAKKDMTTTTTMVMTSRKRRWRWR